MPVTSTSPAISSNARIIRSMRVGYIGQSLAAYSYYGALGWSFTRTLTAALGLANGVELPAYAIGGSYASRLNRLAYEAAHPDNPVTIHGDHADDTGGALADGSVLGPVITRMAARAVGDKIDHAVINLGQAESGPARGDSGLTPAQVVANATPALSYTAGRVRSQSTLGDVVGTKVIVELLGRSVGDALMGYDRIRQAQLSLGLPTVDLYDLELRNNPHLTDAAQVVQGRRSAELLASLLGVTTYTHPDDAVGTVTTIYTGPSISSVTKIDATHVDVAMTGNGETIRFPASLPCMFRFADSAANLTQQFATQAAVPVQAPVSFVRTGNTLRFQLATPLPNAPMLLFPYDNGPDFDPTRLITGTTSGKPLQSWLRP